MTDYPSFDWIPFYEEFATKLLTYKNNRGKLVEIINTIFQETGIKNPFVEKDGSFTDTCPFSVFASFNRGLKYENLVILLQEIKVKFGVDSPVPADFSGVPRIDNRIMRFYWAVSEGKRPDEVSALWDLFEAAITYADNQTLENRTAFKQWFDTITHTYVSVGKITMGLFWIRPNQYLSLDNSNRNLIDSSHLLPKKLASHPTGTEYLQAVEAVREYLRTSDTPHKTFAEFSHYAYIDKGDHKKEGVDSLSSYSPGFTTEDWIKNLNNPEIFTENALRILKCFYEYGGEATCTELSKKYGESPFFYSSGSYHLAKRICEITNCPKPPERESGDPSWWPVLYLGRDAANEQDGSFIWKLRPELSKALEKYYSENPIHEKQNTMTQNYPKNQILFGPPGTGKTYSTVLHAVSIIENLSLETLKQESYETILKRYQQYRGEGSIASVTFHQSYGYEEFIEGIRPILDDNGTTSLSYMLENGVFKEFCQRAKTKDNITIPKKLLNKEPTIWKISLYGSGENAVKTDCFENDRIRIAFYKDLDYGKAIYNAFNNKMQIGDIVLSLYSNKEIDGIGIITSDAVELDDVESYRNSRSVHWVATNIRVNIIEYNEEKVLTMGTVYELSRFSLKVVEEIVEKLQSRNNAPYVFIIDEINRGNISKIFGELISLIEPSKRLGAAESMTVQLPYSKQDFGVPQNVYIIGTMNTADRSLAFLDTALRRRFTFTEMLPDPQLLKGIEIEGIDVSLMLAKINERIEALYDREHTIGHAYFMILKDNPTIECLSDVFSTAIIPLLQEYFFNDYEKIRLVLGDNYKNDALSFIREIPINCRELFHCDVDEVCDVRYEINKEALYTPEAYQKIYQA